MTNQISNNEVRSLLLSCIPAKFTSFSHDQNLIEAGLDSLSIMKITASLRKKGIKLRFGDLMSEPNINAWCRLAQSCSADAAPSEIRKTDEPLRNIKEQKIFNLTDLQNAYWTGRSTEAQLGGVSCHAYIELDGNITNPEKLRDAFSSLCLRHQSLRMRIADGGQMIDRENANEPLNIVNLREMSVEEAEKASTEIRRKISHRCLDVASGKVIGATLLLLPEGFTGSDNIAVSTRLCIDIDLIASDVRSMNIILHDLAALYRGDDLPDVSKFSFARYLELRDEKNREEIERDRLWWAAKASSLPQGPELPVQYSAVPAGTAPVYSRRSFTVGKEKWERLTALCRSRGVTPAMLLCTAYACTLAEYSTSRKFLLNLPLFDREPLMDGTDYAVADFSNLLLLECDFSDHETSFIEQALQLQKKFHEAAGHCAVSGVSVEREIMRAQNTSGPAAPVVFACNLDSPLPDPYASGIIGRLSYMISQTPQVILDHQVYEFNGELYDAWDMADAVFPEGLADDLFNSYRHLLESLAENPQTIYEQINLPLNPETVKERARSNSTGWEIPAALYGDGTIHGRIFRHAAEHPEDPALFFADQQISYGRLRESALRVASLLMLNGLSAGDRVMISVPRGPLEIVSVLGVLAAGGVYVPVSATQPDARRNRIIHTGQIRFMLSTASFVPEDSSVRVLNPMDASSLDCLEAPAVRSPGDPAYIIFTSGSTGEPKGVEISHRGALNTILDITDRCALGRSSTALAVSALDFDLSVFDIFGILGAGGRLVLISSEERRDASCWLSLVHRYGINTWNSVPVLLEMLLAVHRNDNRPLPLTTVMLSGDWINTEIPQDLADACGGTLPHLLAMGGATEGSIWSNLFEVSLPLPDGWKSIPYGYPLRNQKYRIADAKGRDCPDLVPGELWIGGTGVALGYVNAPEITAAHFVEFEGERWYRTGDQGRYHKGGIMEFLGRLDHQVKVRGHRIELGEIESALCSVSEVKRAVAVTVKVGGRSHLAAAVEHDSSVQGLDLTENSLKEAVIKSVPEYMLPETISITDHLPVSSNAKIDRKAIIQELSQRHTENRNAPETELECRIAEIWSEILGTPEVSRDDDFFLCGGDSLSATRFVQLMESRHITPSPLPLRVLFGSTTVKALAEYITVQMSSEQCANEESIEEGTL